MMSFSDATFEIRLPGEGFLFAPGVVARLGVAIAERGGWRVLVLCDRALGEPVAAPLRSNLAQAGLIPHVEFCGAALPTSSDEHGLIRMRRDGDYDTIVAIGGGSITDRGRLAAGIPGVDDGFARLLVAVPTTAGTGVEATDRVWMTDSTPSRRMVVRRGRGPDLIVCDPDLLASGGGTAGPAAAWLLAEALDGLFLPGHAPFARPILCSAIGLIARFGPILVVNPEDRNARAALVTANILASIGLSGGGIGPVGALAAVVGLANKTRPGVIRARIAPHEFPQWRAGDPAALNGLSREVAGGRQRRGRDVDAFDVLIETLEALVPAGGARAITFRESDRVKAIHDAVVMLSSDGEPDIHGERLLALARKAL